MANWIAVIAFGNCHLTKAALASFLAQDIPVNVLVINNASRDSTAAWMATLTDERIIQVHFAAQRSVAACWNFAMKTLDYESHALIANNDVELPKEFYRLMLEDGGPFVTGVGVNTREQMTEAVFEPQNKRPNPDFSAFLVARSLWNVHKFDERYAGGFGEDCQMHVTLHRHGIDAHCIGVPFYHVGSATMKYADPEMQKAIGEQADRNRQLFFKEWGVSIGTPEYDTLFTPETFGID